MIYLYCRCFQMVWRILYASIQRTSEIATGSASFQRQQIRAIRTAWPPRLVATFSTSPLVTWVLGSSFEFGTRLHTLESLDDLCNRTEKHAVKNLYLVLCVGMKTTLFPLWQYMYKICKRFVARCVGMCRVCR